ncbi:MAG TPA: hypothetical protein VIF81_10770, partial [Pyrinomonadaceae bacterium]
MADDATRDRVRALVRDVLSKAIPDTAAPASASASTPRAVASQDISASSSTTVTRDESAKLVITEDDVRGLE